MDATIHKVDSIDIKDGLSAIKFSPVRKCIIVVDVRNFSRWSNLEGNDDCFRKRLLESFYEIIEHYFPKDKNYRKFLGDGVLIIRDYKEEEFGKMLGSLKELKEKFDKKKTVLNKEGFNFDILGLGIGISIGFIKEIIYSQEEVDYMGYGLGLTFRYCNFARPCGVIIDYDSTQRHLEEIKASGLKEGILTDIRGFAGKRVWTSEKVHLSQAHLSTRENEIHQIEVHVAGVCIKKEENYKILIARRNSERKLYPGLWECGGGQVHRREEFEEAIKRQFREEFGVIVEPLKVLGNYKIVDKENDNVIPGIKFLCRFVDYLGNQIILSEVEFDEYKWISEKEIDKYEFILGIKDDIKEAIKIYREIF